MDGKHLEDLEGLVDRCKQADHNSIPIYKHLIDKRHSLPCNLAYYQNNTLVGYLRSFFFYKNACEIALMVDPLYRRQTIARQLLAEIIPIVSHEAILQLIFSTPKDQHQNWFNQLGLSYRSTEFQMQYNASKSSEIQFKPMDIHMAGHDDLQGLVALDSVCFPNKNPNAQELFETLFSTDNCCIFALRRDGQLVGKAHVFKECDRARVTDVGVLDAYRGQGIASALIKQCINHALIHNKPKITLDVEANNNAALKLYLALGFDLMNAHDYWQTIPGAESFGLSEFLNPKSISTDKDYH